MGERPCDVCGRPRWDGGHALNDRECDDPNGTECRLRAALAAEKEAREKAENALAGMRGERDAFRQQVREQGQKLALAGIEGSPPPGLEPTLARFARERDTARNALAASEAAGAAMRALVQRGKELGDFLTLEGACPDAGYESALRAFGRDCDAALALADKAAPKEPKP